jgi:hypothetical protein
MLFDMTVMQSTRLLCLLFAVMANAAAGKSLDDRIADRLQYRFLTPAYGFQPLKPENIPIFRYEIGHSLAGQDFSDIGAVRKCLAAAGETKDETLARICADIYLPPLRQHQKWHMLFDVTREFKRFSRKVLPGSLKLDSNRKVLHGYLAASKFNTRIDGQPNWIRQIPFKRYQYVYRQGHISARETLLAGNLTEVKMNGHPVEVQVDTEAPISFISTATAARIRARKLAPTVPMRSGTGGVSAHAWLGMLDRLMAGGWSIESLPITISDSEYDNGLGNVVGIDLIARFGGFQIDGGRLFLGQPHASESVTPIDYRYFSGIVVTHLRNSSADRDFLVCLDTGLDRSNASPELLRRYPNLVTNNASYVLIQTASGIERHRIIGHAKLTLRVPGGIVRFDRLPVLGTRTAQSAVCDVTLGDDVLLSHDRFAMDTENRKVYVDVAERPQPLSGEGKIVTINVSPGNGKAE